MRAGDVTRGITDDKRLLRRNSVPQEGVRPLLRNRYQGVTVMVVAAIGSELKIMPDTKRFKLELRTHSDITRQQPEHKIRLPSQRFE